MAKKPDSAVVFTTAPVEIGDEMFNVRVHWARVGGQLQVVGLDLRTFWSDAEQEATRRALAKGVDFPQPLPRLTTSVLRGLRFAEVVEQSLATAQAELPYAPEEDAKAVRDAARPDPDQPRRGPAPMLTTEDLKNVVAPAYMNGGTRPVVAVQEALKAVPAMGQHVTKEQARKAVVKAREHGFIPEFDRRTR